MGVSTVIKDYGTDILNAIRENDLQRLKSILDKYLKTDRKIQKLCVSDIKHKPTKKFACPLILAARQEDPRIMKYMMDKGTDPNFIHHTIFSSKRREIVTALHITADLGFYDTVQVLLDANADPNIGDHNHETPLHIAVKKSDKVMVRMLLSRGADPSIPDRRGNAALHIATLYGHLQLVRSLLKYDADVYQKGQWNAIPPHIAAKEGHIHLIQLFCSRDVGNINIKIPCYPDEREKAPIHLASENGHVETVLALLDQFDAEVNLKDSDRNTPLHCVVLNQYTPHRMRDKEYFNETAKILIKFGVSVNERNLYGDTALHLAAMNQFQRIVELLLRVGADPLLENDEKLRPIDVVPDFDPVTKQILKNAMLNPRPPISASRLTLASRDFSLASGQSEASLVRPSQNGIPRGRRSLTPDGKHRNNSQSNISYASTMSVSSSVFEAPNSKDQKRQQQQRGRGRTQSWGSRRSPNDDYEDEDNISFSEIDRELENMYAKPDKKQMRPTQQQPDTRRTQQTGRQHEDDTYSTSTYQDDNTSQYSRQEPQEQIQKILQKHRRNMKPYEDEYEEDDDAFSEQQSFQDQSMDSRRGKQFEHMKEKPRPSPRSDRSKVSSQSSRKMLDEEESVVYQNIGQEDEYSRQATLPLREGQQQGQQQGQPGNIRVNTLPGKPGVIEVQYGGYGGAPISIQFDTQGGEYTMQQTGGEPVVLSNAEEQSIKQQIAHQQRLQKTTDNYTESFTTDTVPYPESLQGTPGYGVEDDTSQFSMMSNDTQPEVVKTAIHQKVADMTETPKKAEAPVAKKKKVPTATLR